MGAPGRLNLRTSLGSSATVRFGILHALNRLARDPFDRSSLFHLGMQLEGHPDNAAPASFGGFTVAQGQNVQQFVVSARLYFVLLIPALEIETADKRAVGGYESRFENDWATSPA